MQTFATPEPIAAVIEIGAGEIHITASDRTETVVAVRPCDATRGSDVTAAEQTSIDFADGTLSVKGSRSWRQWPPWLGKGSVEVRIEVPSGSRVRATAGSATLHGRGRIGDCDVRAGAGTVDIETCGSFAISAGAGNVDIAHVEGHVEIKMSGSVRVGRIDGAGVVKNSSGTTSIQDIAGDVRVTSANGDIVVGRARSTVELKGANGDLRIESAEGGAVVAETARGNVDIGIRDGIAAWLDLNTAFGRVRNDLDAAGPPAAGEDALNVRARTAFGDITIRRASAAESGNAESGQR